MTSAHVRRPSPERVRRQWATDLATAEADGDDELADALKDIGRAHGWIEPRLRLVREGEGE